VLVPSGTCQPGPDQVHESPQDTLQPLQAVREDGDPDHDEDDPERLADVAVLVDEDVVGQAGRHHQGDEQRQLNGVQPGEVRRDRSARW